MTKLLTVVNETRGVILGDRVQEAASFLDPGQGAFGALGPQGGRRTPPLPLLGHPQLRNEV